MDIQFTERELLLVRAILDDNLTSSLNELSRMRLSGVFSESEIADKQQFRYTLHDVHGRIDRSLHEHYGRVDRTGRGQDGQASDS